MQSTMIGSVSQCPPPLISVSSETTPRTLFDADFAVRATLTFLSYVDPTANDPPPFGATDAAFDFLDTAPPADPLRLLAEIVLAASELTDPTFGVAIEEKERKADPQERLDYWADVHYRLSRFLYDNPTISPPADLMEWVDAVPIEEAISALGSAQLATTRPVRPARSSGCGR